MTGVLRACFLVSGAAALGLELLWVRSAGLVLGTTVETAAAVLACYFGGLALGSFAGRRPVATPVQRYALLEVGAALGVAWSVVVFGVLGTDGAQRLLATGGRALEVALLAVAIMPATTCLGATLPALGVALAPAGTVGGRGAVLYAVNTLGGAAGIALIGFGLPAWVGVRGSYVAVGVLQAVVGLVALTIGDRAPAAGRLGPAPPAALALRAIAAGAGALGLTLEVLWIRLFAQVLQNSVYSFAAVSLVFVLALGLGAALAAWLLRHARPWTVAAGALVTAGVATVGGVWSFVLLTRGLGYVGIRTGLPEYVLRVVGLVALTAGPAALAAGVVLPALWAAFGDADGPARPMGELTAANVAGSIAGTLLTAFVVLPVIGVRGAALMLAIAYLVLADAVAPAHGRLRPAAWIALLGLVLLDPLRLPLVPLADGESLRAVTEDPAGVAAVVDVDGDRELRLDAHYVLGGSAAAAAERRQGLVPLLLHPAPHRALFIGMATGITASAGPALGLDETAVVELVPAVAASAAAHFGAWNGDLLARPDVRLVLGDGRRHLLASREQWDVVVADLVVPWHAGAGTLWSRETFAAAARRLAPGGLFCQWLPLYQLSRDEFDVVARTFRAVFPHVTVWRRDFSADRPVIGLVGSLDVLPPLAAGALARRLAALPAWAADSLLATPRGVAMLSLGDLPAAMLPPGPINTDDRPVIEFRTPQLGRPGPAGDKDWFVAGALADFVDDLRSQRDPAIADLPGAAEAQTAGDALARYALAFRTGDRAAAMRAEADVRRLVPEVVAAGERGGSVSALADVRQALGALRAQQEGVRRRLEAMERRLDGLDDEAAR